MNFVSTYPHMKVQEWYSHNLYYQNCMSSLFLSLCLIQRAEEIAREVIVAKKKTFGEASQEVSVEPLGLPCR